MPNSRPGLPMAIAVLVACLLASAGCGRPAPFEGWNVVLIVVDALRASELGAYGYPRATSPTIDALAEDGVVFERASSASSYTRESVASLFTGRLPSLGGSIGWWARPARGADTLASLFRRKGYRTALFSNSIMLRDRAFLRGFEESRFVWRSQMVSRGGPQLAEAGLEFALRDDDRPYFLYLHFLDPHGPYDPPKKQRARFGGPPPPRPLALYGDVRNRCSELQAGGFGPGDPRFEDLVDRYDAEIADTDASLAEFLDGLRSAGRLDHTLLVLTADHGEEFLEHDFVEHAWTVYEESTHVPLVVWAGGALQPGRVERRVSLLDVMPTLALLVDLDRPRQAEDGQALFEIGDGGVRVAQRTGPVFSELMIQSRNLVRSVIDGRWKYVAFLKWMDPSAREAAVRARRVQNAPPGMPILDPFGPVVREELYDLEVDPEEQHDLADEQPERLAVMRRLLRDRLAEASGNRPGEPAPHGPDDISPEDRAQMEALGYIDAGGGGKSESSAPRAP